MNSHKAVKKNVKFQKLSMKKEKLRLKEKVFNGIRISSNLGSEVSNPRSSNRINL